MKKTTTLLALALLFAPAASEAQDRGRYSSGSIRHRPGPPPRPHPRPPVRPPRPGAGAAADAYIRHEIRKEVRREIRREIRDARRDRALFLGGLALLSAITRSLPPRHTTIVVQGATYCYAEGTWYVAGGGYRIVAPPPGVIVPGLPQGYAQQGGAYEYGGVAYREVLGPDGEPGYQVVGAP